MTHVFIDGSSGTTGLRIRERLAARNEISLLSLSEDKRKDLASRVEAAQAADLVFLCLPDAAAKEIAAQIPQSVKVLDTSTAHRTSPDWVYGLPELKGQRKKIAASQRVAVPGCHATGFIVLVAPLRQQGLLPADAALFCHSLTGYSGGGKSMIADYTTSAGLQSPRAYGLSLHHKHLPEMKAVCDLAAPPVFCPIVANFYNGMQVTVPLRLDVLGLSPERVSQALQDYYAGEPQIKVHPLGQIPSDGFLATDPLAGSDRLEIFCTASPDKTQMLLISLFDNLGKGASGAAVQCMNIMLGFPETAGLE